MTKQLEAALSHHSADLHRVCAEMLREVGEWSRATGDVREARVANAAMVEAIEALLPVATFFRDVGGEDELRNLVAEATELIRRRSP
jgi:hypothetical protein